MSPAAEEKGDEEDSLEESLLKAIKKNTGIIFEQRKEHRKGFKDRM